MYGKASFARLSVVSGWRMSRAFGPQMPRQANRDVTSSTATEPSSGACERIQARSCWPKAVPVTMRKRSSASRVTVKSHSIPPRSFSICVYVIAPTSRATLLSQRCSRKSAAPAPETSIFANDVSSKSAAGLASGTVLGADRGRPEPPAQPRGRSDSSPAAAFGSNQFARSQPDFSPKAAPSSCEPRVGGGEAQRPPRLALVARVLDVVVGRVDLERARERVLAARVVPAETARVHLPRVEARPPSTIHSATSRPMPPAPASPCAQKPAATQKPRTSEGPRMNSPSGVNASGPLMRRTTSASASVGTRTIAFCISSSKRSQSSARSLPLKSGGMPSRPTAPGCARSRP